MVSPEDDEARFAPPVGPPVAYWYPPDDPVAAPNGWSPGIIPRPHTQPDIAPPTSPASPVTKRRVGLIASCGTLAVAVVAGIIAIAHSASSAEESLASGSAATASDVAAPSSV